MDAKEILSKVIEYSGINASAFSERLQLKRPQALYDILNEKTKSITPTMANKILSVFPEISRYWLLSGEGDMFKKDEAAPFNGDHFMRVPLVNQYAHAGFLNGYGGDSYYDNLPTIPFIVDKEYKGRYLAFEVKGDSMDDGSKRSLEQGDVLLVREVEKIHWENKLHYKQWDAFVIAHVTEGIIVKQIIDHDVAKGIITCHSLNPSPQYSDIKLNVLEIVGIFNVVKVLKNMR